MDGAAPERIFLRGRWQAQAGWREVLRLAVPLVLSTSAFTLQHFVDRMFLCWHSPVTMAASLPAGLLSFTIISFFMGTASYANTFVAQYGGAGRPRRIGPALWQALYFAAGAACLMPLVIPLAGRLFTWIGHEPHLQQLEAQYFRIMMVGAGVVVYSNAISCFYTGRGRNWPVMWVNFGVTAINIVLDYAMIFGQLRPAGDGTGRRGVGNQHRLPVRRAGHDRIGFHPAQPPRIRPGTAGISTARCSAA